MSYTLKIMRMGEQIADLEWQLQEIAKDNDNYKAENKRLEKQLEQAKEILQEYIRINLLPPKETLMMKLNCSNEQSNFYIIKE